MSACDLLSVVFAKIRAIPSTSSFASFNVDIFNLNDAFQPEWPKSKSKRWPEDFLSRATSTSASTFPMRCTMASQFYSMYFIFGPISFTS